MINVYSNFLYNFHSLFLIIMGKNRAKYQIFHINIIIFSSKHLRNQIQFFQKKFLASYFFVKSNATKSHGNDLYLFQQGFVYLCITSIFSLKTLIFLIFIQFSSHFIFISEFQFQTKYSIVHTLFLRFWLIQKNSCEINFGEILKLLFCHIRDSERVKYVISSLQKVHKNS